VDHETSSATRNTPYVQVTARDTRLAIGADLTAAPSTWTWVDISHLRADDPPPPDMAVLARL